MADKTDRLLRQMKAKPHRSRVGRVEIKAPIADGMFLPNNSGQISGVVTDCVQATGPVLQLKGIQGITGKVGDNQIPVFSINALGLVVGDPTVASDLFLTFASSAGIGTMQWVAGNDGFSFFDEVRMANNEKLEFFNANQSINGSSGIMNITAETIKVEGHMQKILPKSFMFMGG